jgi:pimeloyl-ACP methyl ester carboxylesterase
LYPEKVKSLWLFEPVLMAAVRESDPDLHAQNEAEMTEVSALIAQGDRESATRFFMRIWGDGRPWTSLAPEARGYFEERMTQPCHTQPWLADDVVGVLPQLKSLKMPVHLLDGEKSPAIMAKVQDNLAAVIPNASRETIKGAFHMGPVSHPIECAVSIRSQLGLKV